MSNNPTEEPQDDQAAQEEPVKPTIQQIPNEKFINVYSNSTQLALTPWDIRFIFGEIFGKDEAKNEVIVKQLASVVMSPQHAKAFLTVFTRHFKIWEEQHGVVQIPEDIENL